jgi:hypothetical protein
MKRKSIMLATAMMILTLAAPAWAGFVDFTQLPSSPGSQGASLEFDGLTITAKTNMGTVNNIPDPWMTTAAGGVAGNVYWGDLGKLGTTATTNPVAPLSNYIGLGALTPALNQINPNSPLGPLTLRESLIFTFDQAQTVTKHVNYGQVSYTTDLSFTLLGLNYLNSGGGGFPADSARVFIQFTDGTVIANDLNGGAIATNGADFNAFLNWQLTNSALDSSYPNKLDGIAAIAVEEVYGDFTTANGVRQFGVGSITYEYTPVPEPFTLLLLGAGLIGLAGIRRFGK